MEGLAVLNIVLSFFLCSTLVQSLNILAVLPYQGKSHFFAFQPYLNELARRGHNLTVISHFPQEAPVKNYHDISLAGTIGIAVEAIPLEKSYLSMLKVSMYLAGTGVENCEVLLANPAVQELWRSRRQFDVVVVEQFTTDCALGLAHRLGAPVVGMTSHVMMPWHYQRLGVPSHPAYTPCHFLGGGSHPNFWQRLEWIILDSYYNLLYKYVTWSNERTLAKYFEDIPPLEELAREIKFLLVYQSAVLTGSRVLPANVVEVGGHHVTQPKPLPDAIQKFIDESEHGVIYVSFGSMLKASLAPLEKIEAMVSALSELPQRVLFKWDNHTLPGNPKNVYVSKWMPQNDILAHPKVKAFFSHCGLMGTTEAIHHGVPVVGMPVFGDQPSNAAVITESGLGITIELQQIDKDSLLQKFNTVLDPKFQAQVKLLTQAWHDRPRSPMDTAIFWTEFAAKYTHLNFRSASADVPFYQYLCLDMILVLFIVPLLLIWSMKNAIKNKKQPATKKMASKKNK